MTTIKMTDLGTFNDEGPAVYPVCGECRAAWAFTWCLGMSGQRWLWVRTCKHKSATPVLADRDGKEVETS